MFYFLGYLSGMFFRNLHYMVHGQLGQKHYLRPGIEGKKKTVTMFA